MDQAKQQEWVERKVEISLQGRRLFHWMRIREGFGGRENCPPRLVLAFTGEI